MDIAIRVRKGDIHEKLKAEAIERVQKAARIYDHLISTEIVFNEDSNPTKVKCIVEITSHVKKTVIRGAGIAEDHRSALDTAIDKFVRSLRKYKERLVDSAKHAERPMPAAVPDLPPVRVTGMFGDIDEELISRRKVFVLNRMTEEEAALQLDLLGHDFYLFLDKERGRPNVLYRRGHGDLGLIETIPEES